MSNEQIIKLLKEWNNKAIKLKKYSGEDYKSTELYKDAINFLHFIKDNLGIFHQWCGTYIESLSFEYKLEQWLRYGIKHIKDNAIFRKHWALFFRTGDKPDKITFEGDTDFYDISYLHFKVLKDTIKKDSNINNCKDKEILDIHKGQECDELIQCCICKEQELLWLKEVRNRYKSYRNIFLEKELLHEFITKWLHNVFSLCKFEQEKIHYVWPPIFEYSCNMDIFTKHTTVSIYEHINAIRKSRWQTYYGYEFRPKENYTITCELLSYISSYMLNDTIISKRDKTVINLDEAFIFLTHILTYITYILEIDIKRCTELLKFYSKTSDKTPQL